MPLRANLFDKLSGVYVIRKVTGAGKIATTLSVAAAAGATSMTLTSAADAADKKILLIGAGDDYEAVVENGAAAGSVVTVFNGLKRAHAAGEVVYEGVAYDLGEVAQTKLSDSGERADLESDISRSPYGSRLGFLMYAIGGRMPSLDANHLAIALGMPFSAITGAGTSADPTQLFTDGDDLGREPSFVVAAALDEDANTIYEEMDGCDADYTKVSMPLSQGPDTGLNYQFTARQHPRFVKGALNFTPDATKRITKAQYPEALLDAGFFELDGAGASTTLTAATTVGGTVLALTSGAGVAGGDWFLVEGGGFSQIVWAESLAALNLTIRIRTKYIFPIGSTVKELKLVQPGGLKEGGTTFAIGGSVRPVRFDNARVQAGTRSGTARFSLGFAPTSFALETLRRRLGLPTSVMTSTILTINDLVGTDAPVGCYAKVQRKDGKTAWLIMNTAANTIAALELALSKADMWAVPLEHVAKQVQYLQY